MIICVCKGGNYPILEDTWRIPASPLGWPAAVALMTGWEAQPIPLVSGIPVVGSTTGRIGLESGHELWRMLRRRHSNKSKSWLFRRYWRDDGTRHIFGVIAATKRDRRRYEVIRLGLIGIKRIVKIRADATPCLPEYAGYFRRRRHDKQSRLLAAMSAWECRALTQPPR